MAVAASTVLGALSVSGAQSAAAQAAPQRGQLRASAQAGQDWPTFLHDVGRSSSTTEAILTPANVPYLRLKWSYLTGGIVAASPAVVGGVVYVGSWDGNQYAFNGTTGAVIWKTALGTTHDPVCAPPNLGITSSPTVANGVVYVGGGDSYWYALNASNGAVLWKVFTGDNTQAGAHYNWSSPLILGNFAYIGIASTCDAPLVQGQLLKVDLTSHQVVATANFVPNGQVGGGVWTTPTYDAATNTIFVSTGTLNLYSQTLSQAVVSLDATSLAVRDHWQLPFEAAVSDSDWGTTPTLTTDSQGRQLLSLANKNGILYTLLRNKLAAGPVWQRQIAIGGDCPTCGDGSIASGSFSNGVLYYGGGSNVDANGIGHGGSVTAFDPGTGRVLWYHPTNQPVIGALTVANGVVFDPQGQVFEALDATTGAAIWDYKLAGGTYAAPAISNGIVYIGGVDSQVHAFGLPASLPPPPPADPKCPSGFTCQDLSNPGIAGSEKVNADGSVTVTASGNWRLDGDQSRIITTPASGDFQVSVQDVSETKGNLKGYAQPQLGIVIRQSAALGAPFYAALQDPTYPAEGENVANLIMYYRDTWGGPIVELTQNYPQTFPRYVMVQRHGDAFQTLFSSDGTHYTLISGTIHTIVMPTTLMVGMAVASGDPNATTTAVYQKFTIAPPTQAYIEQNTAHPCPAPWKCWDIGAGSPIGDQTLANGVWTLQGGGPGIAGSTDTLHFVYQPLAGDGSISARLTSLGNTSPQAQAALVMRADTSMASTYYGIVINSAGTATVEWRQNNGIHTRTTVALPTQTLPAWLQVSRYTDTAHTPNQTYYSALTSTNGTTWSQVPGSTVALDLGAHPLAGIAGSSNAPRTQNPSTWDNVSISTTRVAPPGVCPGAYTCADVGQGYQAGSQTVNNGTWQFAAGGSDIWDVYDMFHFVYQPLTADGTVSARVVSTGPTTPTYDDQWEKAGVMLRQTTDPQSPYYGVFETPKHGVVVQWRSAQAGTTSQVVGPVVSPVYPLYLMVGRWQDPHPGGALYYTAYTSTDNVNFTAIPGSTIALALPGTLLAGIAADSNQEKYTLPVTFDNLALFDTEPVPPGACPAAVAGCADIGGATPGGTQTLTNGTLTMNVGGGDIWSNSDQFHLVWQNLSGDGVVSARVASQQNTAAWAKAGVMLRATTDPASPYYAFLATPGHGLAVQYRTILGAGTTQLLVPGQAPAFLEVARFTDGGGTTYYTSYTSADGTTWSQVPGSTVSFTMPAAVLAGWAGDPFSQTTGGQVILDHLAVTQGAPMPAGLCPVGWACADVGAATPAGAQNLASGAWTVQGGGGDIWGAADQFRFLSRPAGGDGTISADVTSQQATNPWAKAGLMMRSTTDPGSAYYAVLVTPAHGLVVQWRTAQGASSDQLAVAGATPLYVEISRWTDSTATTPVTYYSALTSPDGTTWTAVPGSAIALTLQPNFLEGIAVTSHNTTQLSQVGLTAVTLGTTSTEPPGVCSASYTCTDIGAATPTGTQTQSPSAWSISGGGGDIWGTADQFHFVAQAMPGDGTASAHVASVTNTNAWSKAGLMLRADTTAGAAYYAVFVTPGNNLVVQYRTAAGATSNQPVLLASTGAPLFLRITRTGTTFVALTSADGTTWTAVAGSSVSLPGLTGTLLAGMAVTSHDTTRVATARFDTVSL